MSEQVNSARPWPATTMEDWWDKLDGCEFEAVGIRGEDPTLDQTVPETDAPAPAAAS